MAYVTVNLIHAKTAYNHLGSNYKKLLKIHRKFKSLKQQWFI